MAGVTIKQLPSGKYHALVYDYTTPDGKRKYKSITASSKGEVKRLVAVFLSEREEKREEERNTTTLGAAMERYINERCNLLSPSTIAGYRKIVRNYFPDLQEMELGDINSKIVQKRMNDDAAELSNKTLRNNYGFLTAVARENGVVLTLKYPAKKRVIRRLPQPKEVYNIVHGTEIELPVLLAMWLSLRMSEILGIRYRDIENGMLIIRNVRLMVDTEAVDRDMTKTENSTRALKLPVYLLKLCGTGDPDDYVIKLTANAITKRFYRMCESAEMQHITFHDLRHVNASVMLRLGVSDAIAMERGGWSSPAVLKSVYQETFVGDREQADTVIDEYFTALVTDVDDANAK